MSCDDIVDQQSLPVDLALQAMLSEVAPVSACERVPLWEAVGRVLAQSVVAARPVPAHANSAVDGYAVRASDLAEGDNSFRVAGVAYAGSPYQGNPLAAHEAVRIMTGAVMPDGADTVVMQEQTQALDDDHVRFAPPLRAGANVRQAGEDLRAGEVLLACGRWLMPADIGLLASVGLVEISVYRRLRVGVLSTGDEVRGLGGALTPGMVYDSNRYQLSAALRRMGAEVCDLGIVRDDPGELVATLHSAATHLDLIVSSGGVSSGAADRIREVVADIGRISLWRVAMKPGRPLAFGSVENAIFFGLPGNPVAALVAFCWFVRPVLEKRMGVLDRPLIPLINAMVETPLQKQPGRMEFQRGILTPRAGGSGYQVRTTGNQGSGILRSMSLANGLIVLPAAEGPVAAGSQVAVLPFSAVF